MTNSNGRQRSMPFAGNPLDRASNQRGDEGWLEEQYEHPDARFLLFSKLNVLVKGDPAELDWIDRSLVPEDLPKRPVLLGLQDGLPHFAVDVSHIDDPTFEMGLQDARWGEARSLATDLAPAAAGILAQARSLLDWHNRHGFCAVCGGVTQPGKGGTMRRCGDCAAQHFPRTDPVVIMLVHNGDKALLGRRAGRAGIFSTVAGFIDQGETIEDAVRREVMEEVGVRVDDVRYIASQPWPFPSSLMIGCFAHTSDTEATVDEEEIAEARWFTRDELRAGLLGQAPDFAIPGPVAIAHHLIADWCEQQLAATSPSIGHVGTVIEDPFGHSVDSIIHKAVRCPGCKDFVFKMWPEGWDGHAGWKCAGLKPGTPEDRKLEYRERFGSLFR